MLARAFCNERLLIELNGGALRVHGLGSAHLDGTRMAEGDAAQKNAVVLQHQLVPSPATAATPHPALCRGRCHAAVWSVSN